jgi:hypothetical protein
MLKNGSTKHCSLKCTYFGLERVCQNISVGFMLSKLRRTSLEVSMCILFLKQSHPAWYTANADCIQHVAP